jgi:hypothetical protein
MMPGIPVQSPVDNRGFHVKQLLRSGSAPSHLVLLAHAPADQLIDGAGGTVNIRRFLRSGRRMRGRAMGKLLKI